MQNQSNKGLLFHPVKKTSPNQVVAILLVFVLVFSLLGATPIHGDESPPALRNEFGNNDDENLIFTPQSRELVQQDFSGFEVFEGLPDLNPSNLSEQERQRVLAYMSRLEPQGLQGFSDDFASNPNEVLDIIVQFITPPSEVLRHSQNPVARLNPEAQALAAHGAFMHQLGSIFTPFGFDAVLDIVQSYSTLFNGVQMLASAGLVYQIANLPEVFAISPNYEIYAQSTFPSPHTSMFMAEPIYHLGVEAINNQGFTGAGFTVAVLDTGVDWNHPRLADNFVGGWCFIRNNDQPMEATFREWEVSGQPLIDNRGASFITMHGTHVAGIVVGITPEVRISAYRVLGPFGRGSVGNSIAAIEMAYMDGADVMNLSLGATVNLPFDPQAFAANVASLNGVVMVISAGNSGSQGLNSIGTPAVASLPITVGNGLWGGFGGNGFLNARTTGNPFEVTVTGWAPGDTFADNTINSNIGFDIDANGYFAYVNVGAGTVQEFNALGNLAGAIAVVHRGTSAFTDMLARAIDANAGALLVVNNQGNTRLANVMVQGERIENEIPVLSVRGVNSNEFSDAGRIRLNALTLGVPADRNMATSSSIGPVNQTFHMGLDIVAPGTNIMSAVPNFYANPDHSDIGGWDSAYRLASGTSMSAPIVAGAAALMLNAFPGASPYEIKARMMKTATMAPLAYGNYSVFHTGAGFLDIEAALTQQSFAVVPTYIPWLGNNTHFGPGNAPQTLREEPLASLNFGVIDSPVSQPLTVQFNNQRQWQVEVTHGSSDFVYDATGVSLQYERLANGDLVFTKHFSPYAALNRRYDGLVILTSGDCRIVLPFASFYGDGNPAPTPRNAVGIVRPILTSRTDRDWVASPDHAAFSAAILGFDDPMGTSLPTNLYAVPIYGNALSVGHQFFLGQLMLPANVDIAVSRAASAWGYNITTGEEDAALATGIWELRFAPQDSDGYAAWGSFSAGRFIIENEGPTLTMDAINLTDASDPHYPYVYSIIYPRNSETVPVSGRIFSPSHELAIQHQIYSVMYIDANTNAPAIYDYRFATYWLRDVGMAGFAQADGSFAVNVPYSRLSQFTAFGDARLPNNYALDAHSEDFVTIHIGIIQMPMWGMIAGIRTNFVTLIYMVEEALLALGWDNDYNSLNLTIDRFTPAITSDNIVDILTFEYRTEAGEVFTLNPANMDVNFNNGQMAVSFHEIAEAIGQVAIGTIYLDIDAPEAGVAPQYALEANELFTSQVAWYPNHGLFHFDTEYTLTVTLWASGGIQFDENLAVSPTNGTVASVAVRDDGLMAEIDIVFDATEYVEAGYAIAILHVSDPSGLGSGPFMNFNDHALLFDPTATMAPLIDRIQAGVESMPPDFWYMFDRDMNVPYFFWDNPMGGIQHGQASRILPAGTYDWMWTGFRTANTFGWGSLVMHPNHVYEFYLWVDWDTMTFGVDVTEYHVEEWRALNSAVPSRDLLSATGEDVTITFRGILPSREIGIFLGGEEIQAPWATSNINWHGTPHRDDATITFPPNTTGSNQVYTVRLADGAGGWFPLETTITVSGTVIERPAINRVVFDIRDQRPTDFYQIFIDSTATANYRTADRENMRRDSFDIFIPYFLEDHGNAVIIPGRHYIDLPVGRYSIGIANYWSNRVSHIDFFNNIEIREGHHYEFFVERWDIWPYWLNIDGVPVPRGVQALELPIPVAGEVVPEVIITRDAYTAVVTWYPAHDVFEQDTIYTAYVALTPVPGQILNYITNFTVQGSAGPVRNVVVAEDYANFSVNFPMTDTIDTPPGQVRVTLITPPANLFTSAFGVIGYQLMFNSAADVFPLSPADINPANGHPFFSALRNFSLWDIHMPYDAASGGFVYMNGRRSAFVYPGIYDVGVLSYGHHPDQGLFSFLSPAYGFINSMEFVYGYSYTITMSPGSLQNLDVRRFDMAGNPVDIPYLNFDPGSPGTPPPPPVCEIDCNCDAPCGTHCDCDHTPPSCEVDCACTIPCGDFCYCYHGTDPVGGLARLVMVSNPAGFVPFAAMFGLDDIQGYQLLADSTATAFANLPEINFGNVLHGIYDISTPFVGIGAEHAIYVEAGTFDIALVSMGTGPNGVPVIDGDIYGQAPGTFVLTVFQGMEITPGHEYRFIPWGFGQQTAPLPPVGTPVPELMPQIQEITPEYIPTIIEPEIVYVPEIIPPRYSEEAIAAVMAFAEYVFSQTLVIYEVYEPEAEAYEAYDYDWYVAVQEAYIPPVRYEESPTYGLVTGFSQVAPAMALQTTLAPEPITARVTLDQFPQGVSGDLVRLYAILHDITLTTDLLVTVWDTAPTIRLAFEAGQGGQLVATLAGMAIASPAEVAFGSQVVFTATPDAGYAIASWEVDGTPLAHTNSTHTITLRADTTVAVNFEAITATEPPTEPTTRPPVVTPPATPPVEMPTEPPLLPLVPRPTQPTLPATDYDDAFDDEAPLYDAPLHYVPLPAEALTAPSQLLLPIPPAPIRPTASHLTFTAEDTAAIDTAFIDPATNRMMVPLRTLAETMGIEVAWDSATRGAVLQLPTGTLILPVDEALPDDMGTPMIVYDRAFVPLRFVMYALDAQVEWDGANRTAVVSW